MNKEMFSTKRTNQQAPLLAIGGSAGALKALLIILAGLKKDMPMAVVIIQHLDINHSKGLLSVLKNSCPLPVVSALEGHSPTKGTVYLAQTNDHLIIDSYGNFHYQQQPLEQVYRPSVDEFFASIAMHWKSDITAMLLSGMGEDGALGLLALRRLGHHTIAQEKSSCGVFGMPKAAISRQVMVEILTPAQFVNKIHALST
ncbi:chemotaxis protein CheB [Psychromonas sp. KJ10-10]|uniref:chemotaxis protein CheB n=1 Tax=Psychromonas sp. KJ10-10 TaxID=3391823 RepID=UPI0039B419D3